MTNEIPCKTCVMLVKCKIIVKEMKGYTSWHKLVSNCSILRNFYNYECSKKYGKFFSKVNDVFGSW